MKPLKTRFVFTALVLPLSSFSCTVWFAKRKMQKMPIVVILIVKTVGFPEFFWVVALVTSS